MRGHRHQADGTHRHPGQGQAVVAAVVVQIGGCHDLGCGAEISLGVLHGDDAVNLGQATVGFGGNRDARAARDVVKHHGSVGGLGHGGEVGVHSRLGRLVVVGGHDQQAVHADLLCTVGQLNGVRGVV